MASPEPALSPFAVDLLGQLRAWAASLPSNAIAVREEHNPKYGGFLFEVRPMRSDTIEVTVGLGTGDDVDFFWGEGYRWEGWTATAGEVLGMCDAIKDGDIIEETWTWGPFVVERRCYIRARTDRAGDGSFPMPAWVKRRATLTVRRFSPWLTD